MIRFFWKRLEPYIQAAITERILLFNKSLIRKGQINRVHDGDVQEKSISSAVQER